MPSDTCDILIVGGGIHGVGVAQAAAAAGYQVVLLEQTSLAAGTSSKSSKLIHGGLRYLETLEFALVRESLRERELLLRLAPSLVHRCPFFIPIYETTSRNPTTIRAGLSLYALLAGLGEGVRFRQVKRREWDQLDGLRTEGLRAVFQYWDAQTDDERLTAAVMASAQSLGARLECPARFLSAEIREDGCRVQYERDGQRESLRTSTLVNATGPWANQVLQGIQPVQPTISVDHVQGTHIELNGEVTQGAYYVESPTDRRAVFVIPWKSRTLVGTTEKAYHGDPSQVKPLDEEIRYLVEVYHQHFPHRDTEVLHSWAGLRVLPSDEQAAFRRSRETQLPVDQERRPRLVSVFGGKLTGYRATAEKVLRRLAATLPQRKPIARTSELPLVANNAKTG